MHAHTCTLTVFGMFLRVRDVTTCGDLEAANRRSLAEPKCTDGGDSLQHKMRYKIFHIVNLRGNH